MSTNLPATRRELLTAAAASTLAGDAARAEQGLEIQSLSSGVVRTVSDRLALAKLDPAAEVAWLAERGREGIFFFDKGNYTRDVAADPRQGVCVAGMRDRTGRTGIWQRHNTRDVVDTAWFGQADDADQTGQVQAALDFALRTPGAAGEEVLIRDVETQTIVLRSPHDVVRLRLRVEGTWTNLTRNGPHLQTSTDHATNWGWQISGRGLVTWSTPGDGATLTGRSFLCVSNTGHDHGLYNSRISGLSFANGHYLVEAEGELWGVEFENLPSVRPTGGLIRTRPPAAMPRLLYKGVYLSLYDAVGPVFDHTGPVHATYIAVELNNLDHGPVIIADAAGGSHVLVSVGVEAGRFATRGRGMFAVANSVLVAQSLYLNALQVTQPTYVFVSGGAGQVRGRVSLAVTVQGAGALYVAGAGDVALDDLVTTDGTRFGATAPPMIALTDMITTDAAQGARVEGWTLGQRRIVGGGGRVQIAHDDPDNIVLPDELARDTIVSLPALDNLWTGRSWTIRRLGSGAGRLVIVDGERLVGEIPPGRRGMLHIAFDRSLRGTPRAGWTCERYFQE